MANPSKFTWTDPTTNTDGSALGSGEVTGYLVGVRPASGTAGTYPSTALAPPTATSELVSAVAPAITASGTYFAAIQTQSTSNGNSAWSSEINVVFAAAPNPPTNFSAA